MKHTLMFQYSENMYCYSLFFVGDISKPVNTVYVTVSALPSLRKYNDCNVQQRQIFKWQQVATFGSENSERRSRVGWAVLLCIKILRDLLVEIFCMQFALF